MAAVLGRPAATRAWGPVRPEGRLGSQLPPCRDRALPAAGVTPDQASLGIWPPADPSPEIRALSGSGAWHRGCACPTARSRHPPDIPRESVPAGSPAPAPAGGGGALAAADRSGCCSAGCSNTCLARWNSYVERSTQLNGEFPPCRSTMRKRAAWSLPL